MKIKLTDMLRDRILDLEMTLIARGFTSAREIVDIHMLISI